MLLEDPADAHKGTGRATTRPIVVQKYGGSSVADTDKLGRVADRVVATRHAGYDVVVVVSAMGKTTDGLLRLAREVAGESAPPRRELDMLVSTGERVAMSLLSIAIQARGLDAISFTGSQSGIITNDRHFDARIIEVRPHRIEDELSRGRVVIIAGYQGMSYRREITTLGRGGTDTTAVAIAAALQAERCEIYSDVDGVYSADPRVVADAAHLPELDYAMVQELAVSGAKVLCAQAVEWARKSGVAIYARSTFDPIGAESRETVVRQHGPGDEPRARAVSCDRNVALLSPPAAELPALLARLEASSLTVLESFAGAHGAHVLLSLLNAPDWPAARAKLGTAVTEGVTLVSVVGSGLTDRADTVASFRRTVASVCPAELFVATPLRLSAVVADDRADELTRSLHASFVRV
jgi:aspartate kinase